jgi:hypothetical protein
MLTRPELYFGVFYQNGYYKLAWMTEKEWDDFCSLLSNNESAMLFCQLGKLEMVGCSKDFANFVLSRVKS